MPVLKDMECTECGSMREALVGASETLERLGCAVCKCETSHISPCWGGTKTRYRFNNWTPSCSKFEYIGVEAYHENEDGSERPSVDVHTKKPVFEVDKEGIAERRDKLNHKKGKNPLYFTQKGR